MCEEGLDDATLAGHVVDHGQHVVAGRADQRWPKHDGQVSRLHFVVGGVRNHFAQMLDQVLECFVVCVGQCVD